MPIIDSHTNEGKRRKEIKIRCCWFRKRSKKEVPGLYQPILTPPQPCHPLILTALGKTPRLSLTLWSKLSLFLEAVSIVIIHEVLDHDKFNLIYFGFLSHFLFFFYLDVDVSNDSSHATQWNAQLRALFPLTAHGPPPNSPDSTCWRVDQALFSIFPV